MPKLIEAFAVIGSLGFFWVQFNGKTHVAITGPHHPATIICDVQSAPDVLGRKSELVDEPALPICQDCRDILEDLYAQGARDLLKGLASTRDAQKVQGGHGHD